MKRNVCLCLCALMLLCCVVSGCTRVDPEAKVIETAEVLYVEQSGFIAKLSTGNAYVQYPNAENAVGVGDTVEITFYEIDHVISDGGNVGGIDIKTVVIRVLTMTKK